MISILLISVFCLGYFFIATESWHRMDKMIPALLMMIISWSIIFINIDQISVWLDPRSSEFLLSKLGFAPDLLGTHQEKINIINDSLIHYLGKTAEIIVFLIGAMTIVELIEHFKGFDVIHSLIQSKTKYGLLITLSIITFFLSSIIDNLTATLVMIAIYRKFIADKTDRMWFAGFIIISANAGGAWSPIGDVTTTMLWVGNKISTIPLIVNTFFPAFISAFIPLLIAKYLKPFKSEIQINRHKTFEKENALDLFLGMFLLILVPVFKILFGIPPYLGMMLSLCVFAIYAEIKTRNKQKLHSNNDKLGLMPLSPTIKALQKVNLSTLLFFLGILLTVSALEGTSILFNLGQVIQHSSMTDFQFISSLGFISAIVDNVPIVAGCMGLIQYPCDHSTWHLLAYAAGTGGSILIIGSAAGVVAMGLEKISFVWYLKNIAPLALTGYVSGLVLSFFYM